MWTKDDLHRKHDGRFLRGEALLAKSLFADPHPQLLLTTAAFFAVVGHLFPVWLKFSGGKGVAMTLACPA